MGNENTSCVKVIYDIKVGPGTLSKASGGWKR